MKWFRGVHGAVSLVTAVCLMLNFGCGEKDAVSNHAREAASDGREAASRLTGLPAHDPGSESCMTDSESIAVDTAAESPPAVDNASGTDGRPTGDADLAAGAASHDPPSGEGAVVPDAPPETAPSAGVDTETSPAADTLPSGTTPSGSSNAGSSKAGGESADHQVPKVPVDREPLFVDWPPPKLALVLTGRQYGYLEPCGCSGLENQNGGLIRRSTLLTQLAKKGWPVIPIDAGNQVRRFGRQAEIKFQITVEGLRTMGYRAIAFGPDDLKLPGTELVANIAPADGQQSIFVSANVTVFDASFTSPFLVLEQGGKKIGVTAILGDRNQKQINNVDVMLRPAEEGLAEVWPKLQQQKCDLYVLIAHASTEESVALARTFPQFQLVVTTGGAGEPTLAPEKIEGTKSLLVQVGTKGMYACAIGLFDDAATPIRYQRIPLDARFPDSQGMLQLLAAYQEQLKDNGFDGLGIRPQPHPSGVEFAGSKSCEECHEEEYKIWKEGRDNNPAKHSHAYATLLQPPGRANVPRNFDPECLSCHVVGWNPQNYYPYKSGYLSFEQTPELIDVGCENCHGPGAAHNAAEDGVVELDEDQIAQLRKQVTLTLEDAEQKCLQCHDLDNSPAFQEEGAFQRYWEKVKHGPDDKDKSKKARRKRTKKD